MAQMKWLEIEKGVTVLEAYVQDYLRTRNKALTLEYCSSPAMRINKRIEYRVLYHKRYKAQAGHIIGVLINKLLYRLGTDSSVCNKLLWR